VKDYSFAQEEDFSVFGGYLFVQADDSQEYCSCSHSAQEAYCGVDSAFSPALFV
jgi:hypothetical protein